MKTKVFILITFSLLSRQVFSTTPVGVANDESATAIVVSHTASWCSGPAAYTTLTATPDGTKPLNWATSPNNNVWFKFQATTAAVAIMVNTGNTEGTLGKPRLALHTTAKTELRSAGNNGEYDDIGVSYEGLTVGDWYYITVDNGPEAYEQGTFTLCVNNVASQDYPSGAVVLTDLNNWCSGLAAYTTMIGTPDGAKPANWGTNPNNNVWFKFQATTTAVAILLKTGGAEGTLNRPRLALHTSAMAVLRSAGDIGANTDIGLSYEGLTVGQWYYINVDNGPDSYYERGTFTVCINSAASQDYPSGAVVLTDLNNWCSGLAAYTTVIGTPDGAKPSNWLSGPNNNIWFKFQATTASIAVHVKTGETEGTLGKPRVALHNNALTALKSTGDNGEYVDVGLSYEGLTVGEWYYINVDNGPEAYYERGTFTLCVSNIPTQDYPSGAVVLANINTWCSAPAAYSTVVGSPDGAKPNNWTSGPNNNIWFKFQATSNAVSVGVKTGDAEGTLGRSQIALHNSTLAELRSVGNTNRYFTDMGLSYEGLTIGEWYYINVDNGSDASERGTFTLCVNNKATNDYPSQALVLADINQWCSAQAAYTTMIGTPDGATPANWISGPNNNIWFKFQAVTKGVSIDLKTGGAEGNLGRPALSLHTDALAYLQSVSSNSYEVDVNLTYTNLSIGSWYYIAIDNGNYANDRGSFTVCVNALGVKAPTNLAARFESTTSVQVTWADNATNETGFQIERSLATGTGFALIATVPANTNSYSSTGLAENTTYYYRVRAVNATDNSEWTPEVSIVTLPPPPAGPLNVVATLASPNSVTVTWTDTSTDETGFQVERSSMGTGNYVIVTTTPPNTSSFSDTGLVTGIKYYYRVRAVNGVVNSLYATEVFVEVPVTPPLAPFSLTAFPVSSTSINLKWSDGSSTETGFQIERSLTTSTGYLLISTTSANALSYIDNTPAPKTTYYYRVRAINSGGNSAYTTEVNTTTPDSPPLPPANVRASAGSATSINLSWLDKSTNETGFQIERSVTLGAGYSLVSTTEPNTQTYLDSELASGTAYYYRIRAINGGGNSVYTQEANATLFLEGVTQLCTNLYCNSHGGIGIGTQVVPTGYALAVKGKIMAEGVKVALQTDWPDYVFENNYNLIEIPALRKFIATHGHLPNVPKAETVKKEGFDVAEINVLLVEKIEEMSLYLIQMEERIKKLEAENQDLKKSKKTPAH